MKRITIIGGGASGTLLAVNLIKNAGSSPIEVNLIESRSRVGKGVAFGTNYDTHLLNVPAAKMGGFHDDIEHFHRWLGENNYLYEANSFVPRRIFGKYLGDLLKRSQNGSAPPSARLNILEDEAIDISRNGDLHVSLRSGKEIHADHVVLAFGNFLPPHPSVEGRSFIRSELYFQDPWTSKMYEMIKPQHSVFIVGTGLSMVDVVMHFHQTGHSGKVSAISTRGLLPAVHDLGFTYPPFHDELRPMRKITQILKAVRRHIAEAHRSGSNWRAVIDSLRPITHDIWINLPLSEKKYFKQHLSRYWNVARHRMPAEAAAIIYDMRSWNQLEILKGRLRRIEHDGHKFEITYTTNGVEHSGRADVLVNCIGSESNFSKLDSPLVQNLMERGLVKTDDLSMGLDATSGGEIIASDGNPSGVIFTLGTALKGILWESTAIPEIRLQAHKLSLKLLAA